jgi:hypothetical protein
VEEVFSGSDLTLAPPLAAAMILSGSLVQNKGLWFGIGIGDEAGDRMLEFRDRMKDSCLMRCLEQSGEQASPLPP